ncbi:MAG: putative addiction module antidote protein [Elusimicrobia bacterium]|nr:putative addiction module antidote protein [Elusimicrobiota bacterium]
MKSKTYQKELIKSLKDPEEASAYLNAALEEKDMVIFLVALRNVAEAFGGLATISKKAHLNRENLYRMLSKQGNPEVSSLEAILESIGLRLAVEVKHKHYKDAA